MDRAGWAHDLRGDPLPWLLEPAAPAVRHLALRHLLGRPADDPEVVAARTAAMASPPISTVLDAQDADGWWVAPGPSYGPKYRSTTWNVIFLDQMGADGADPRIRAACGHVLDHDLVPGSGFGVGQGRTKPRASMQIHCLNGNLLRAMIGFGWGDDARVRDAIAWEVGAVLGTPGHRFSRGGTPGPGFACGANEGLPCGWGATKALLALARIPAADRTPDVSSAIDAGVGLLLSVPPETAGYPTGWGNAQPSGSWFRLGFPSGYVADVLQAMEAVCEAGAGGDARMAGAVDWLVAQQGPDGRFANRYAYAGEMVADVDAPGKPSRWVTLRACRVLRAVHDAAAAGSHAALRPLAVIAGEVAAVDVLALGSSKGGTGTPKPPR